MGVGRDMVYAQYTDDHAQTYSVRIDTALKANADAGFGDYSAGDPVLPAHRMRYALGVNAGTGQRSKIHIGNPTCDLWTGGATTFTRPQLGSGTAVTYTVTVTRGEKVDRGHPVANV